MNVWLLLVAALLAPLAAAAEPARLNAADLRKVEAALAPTMGRFDAPRHCWPITVREDGAEASACLRIIRAYRVDAGGAAQVHVLLSGKARFECHACSGVAAFAVLAPSGPAWTVIARPVPRLSGEYGTPVDPRHVALTRLGAARWGWIEISASEGQGFVEGVTRIFMLRGDAVVKVGELPGDRRNTGACEPRDPKPLPPCVPIENIKITAASDALNPAAVAYPIILRARGRVGRGAIDKQLTVGFDEARSLYAHEGAWP